MKLIEKLDKKKHVFGLSGSGSRQDTAGDVKLPRVALASAVTKRGTAGSRSEHRRVSLDHQLARSASESWDLDSVDLASDWGA